jgi:hypothetical protein
MWHYKTRKQSKNYINRIEVIDNEATLAVETALSAGTTIK